MMTSVPFIQVLVGRKSQAFANAAIRKTIAFQHDDFPHSVWPGMRGVARGLPSNQIALAVRNSQDSAIDFSF